MDRLDNHNLDIDSGEILVFLKLRNEILRLPWLLNYYRKFGVSRFFIVDNGSTDGSTKYLLSQKDVHLFYTTASYAAAHSGMDWINKLLKSHAIGKWTLTIDADEIFIFPGYENINLNELIYYLDREGFDGVQAPLLDMYSDKPIDKTVYQPGTDFLEACPYFDGETMTLDFRGGVRKRLFWDNSVKKVNPPVLMKYPLIKWQEDRFFKVGTHTIEGLNVANISGVLQHFKMFSDFKEKVTVAVEEKEYWQGASQYAVYLVGIQKNPKISPYYFGSVRFENSHQLVKMGIMSDSTNFIDFRSR